MKKKSAKRIHVSKVESAREFTINKPLKTIDFKRNDSKIPMTTRSKYTSFIPTLKLPSKSLTKLERAPTPSSSTVRFLTEPTKYSDPNSINNYISQGNDSQKAHDSAKRIQGLWRKIRDNKKTFCFLHFVYNLYKIRAKFPMHLWLLSRRFPASVSLHHYEIVVEYMKSRHYLYFIKGQWITDDFKSYLLTFDQYCKTNCILIDTKFDITKIIKFVQIIMRPLIRETFLKWREMNETSRILSKQNHRIKTTFQFRSVFRELFWTFVFWRRWSHFHRTRNIEEASNISNSVYLFEWNIYHAKKIQKFNIITTAFSMRDVRLQKYAFRTMRDYCLMKIKLREERQKIVKVANKHSMSLAFRSFIFFHVQCSIEKSMKYRVISSWYKVTDKNVLQKSCLTAFRNRINIKLMMNSVAKWKEGIYENSIFLAYLFDSVQKNQLLGLKTGFFLMGDFIHYQFVSSYLKWRKIMWMKKRSLMLINWSLNYSKQAAFKNYLFDLFHQNCLHKVNFFNYFPFKSEFVKQLTNSSIDISPNVLTKRKAKFIKLVQSLNEVNNIEIKSFTTTVNDTIYSYYKVEDFPCYKDDWCKNATSEEVKTLFYHLVIIKAYSGKRKFTFHKKIKKFNVDEINQYREKKNLLTLFNVRNYRKKQEEAFEMKRKALIQKMNRDSLLLTKKDVYLALLTMKEVNPNFSINPPSTFAASKTIKDGETILPSSSSGDLNESNESLEELKYTRKKRHPMLNPISTLKDGINKTNRKLRRPPRQLFTEETNLSSRNRSIRIASDNGLKGNRAKKEEGLSIIYEKHIPVRKENRNEYFKEKEQREKEELENMPPPLEKMPTILNAPPLRNRRKEEPIPLSSHHSVSTDSLHKFMASQGIDLSSAFTPPPSRLINSEFQEEEEEISRQLGEDEINKKMSEIERISFPYVSNENYSNLSSVQQRDILNEKYSGVIDVMLDKGRKAKQIMLPSFGSDEEEEEEESIELPQSLVIRMLNALKPPPKSKKRVKRNLNELNRQKKKRRRPLFQDRGKPFEKVVGKDGVVYSKSSDPLFSKVLFIGDQFMTRLNLTGKLPENCHTGMLNKKVRKKENKSPENEEEEEEDLSTSSSSFDIPGFQQLLNEVGQHLANSFDLSIDEQEKEMMNGKTEVGNGEKVILIMNKLARNAVKSQSIAEGIESNKDSLDLSQNISELVSIPTATPKKILHKSTPSKKQSGQLSKKPSSIRLSSHLEFEATKEKRTTQVKKKLNPKSTIILKKKFTFTQDLLSTIHEASQIAHPLLMQYYKDVTQIGTLKQNIKTILDEESTSEYASYDLSSTRMTMKEKNQIIKKAFDLNSPQSSTKKSQENQNKEVVAEEFTLSINGKTTRRSLSIEDRRKARIHHNTLKTTYQSTFAKEKKDDLLKVSNLRISQS